MNEIIYPPCKHCGCSHKMGIEEIETGKIDPIDICHDCLWKDFKFEFKRDQVELKSMQENLKYLVDKLLHPEK